MFTPRGWWLLLIALFVTALGTVLSTQRGGTLPIIGLTLLAWLAIEWVIFQVGVRWNLPRLALEREVRDERGPVVTLWAGHSFDVLVRLHGETRVKLPFALIDDRFPFAVKRVGGSVSGAVIGNHAEIRYRIRCQSAGQIRFEGVRLRFADRQGFFLSEVFLRQPLIYPVLPPLVDAEANMRTDKRHNILMPPGIHRMRRAGSGSELLELRDYRPGDPPKMIAWKPSARRDKLITKEFETEVPVRCTFFVDASQSVRLGPPGRNALARVVEIASSAAQATLANRDHAGLVYFDEHEAVHVRPARGQRHLIGLLRRLAEIGRLPPSATQADAETLMQLALPLAYEVYPELMDPSVNSWRWWLPILFPKPEYLRKLTLSDALLPWWRRLSISAWIHAAKRKRLAALLALQQGAGPGALSLLMEDDQYFGLALQQFLAEHQAPYPVPLYNWRGKYLFASKEKVEVLSTALLRAVRRGNDNELFVLLADLYELEEHLEPLRRAIRVAVGRHHRVILICPWPTDIPPPGEALEAQRPEMTIIDRRRVAAIERYHVGYEAIRRDLGRIGVTVINAARGEAVQLILDRMEQLRVAGIRR